MTICEKTGLACGCQPEDGIPCIADNGSLRRMMLEWRAAALKAQAELAAIRAAAPGAGDRPLLTDALVKRLREAGSDYTLEWGSGDLYDEAADEIDRLLALTPPASNPQATQPLGASPAGTGLSAPAADAASASIPGAGGGDRG